MMYPEQTLDPQNLALAEQVIPFGFDIAAKAGAKAFRLDRAIGSAPPAAAPCIARTHTSLKS